MTGGLFLMFCCFCHTGIAGETRKFRPHHEMYLFMMYVLKRHSFCWASRVEVSFLQMPVNCCSPETDTLLQISSQGDLWSALCNCSFLAGFSSLSFASKSKTLEKSKAIILTPSPQKVKPFILPSKEVCLV